ncbi:hypothetical protein [Dongshaea marina]|uniref:hypothetical protein n=1 Tax=Dongshaea marina TaxID=2047966 RepID=UPI000D3EA39D|nr:hypothetical protein [Dongshaea marina]
MRWMESKIVAAERANRHTDWKISALVGVLSFVVLLLITWVVLKQWEFITCAIVAMVIGGVYYRASYRYWYLRQEIAIDGSGVSLIGRVNAQLGYDEIQSFSIVYGDSNLIYTEPYLQLNAEQGRMYTISIPDGIAEREIIRALPSRLTYASRLDPLRLAINSEETADLSADALR